MHFTISSSALQKELSFIQGVVERKSTIPALSTVLIESLGDDKVRFTGTDLDLTLRCETEVEEVDVEGDIIVMARKLFEIARLLPDAVVRLKKESNDWVSVKCDRSNFKLPGVLKDSFPEVPVLKPTTIQIPAGSLRLFIERTAFAITQEESRYTLSGAKFVIKNGTMQMITTDGHRLALMEGKGLIEDKAASVDVLIPRKALGEVLKVSAGLKTDDTIGFGLDENHMYFQIGQRSLISRLLYGQFPQWEMVLPKDTDKQVKTECAPLSLALKRAAVMADDRSHALRLNIGKNQIAVSGQTAEEGEALETVPAEYGGEDLEIGFNGAYLNDFFSVVGSKECLIELKDGQSQALLSIPGEDSGLSFRYVVMPLRL